MSQFLKIYQIYYQDSQLANCDYRTYNNAGKCTVYFENSVISSLIKSREYLGCEYFGVVSHKLRETINTGSRGPRINQKTFYPDQFEEKLQRLRPDVMGFLEYMPHDPVRYFLSMHPKLPEIFEYVTKMIGFPWEPTILKDVFYSNSFVCESALYKKYVTEFLNPAIEIMNGADNLINTDSGYPYKLPEYLQAAWGIKHYPYNSFICERLFSYWVHLNNLEVKYY